MIRHRYDRAGEIVEDDSGPELFRVHDPRCRDGWLGEDGDGRLIPCLTCRPHLAGRRERFHHMLNGSPS